MAARTRGGKRSCIYYQSCGTTENCARCTAFKKIRKGR